jgi:elongin-C
MPVESNCGYLEKISSIQVLDNMLKDEEDTQGRFIKLVSAEGHEFFVDRQCAMVSGTIKAMLEGQFAENRGEVRLPEIAGHVLEKVIQYMYYKVRYTNSPHRVPQFNIEPEIALETLMCANYLDL